MTLAPESGLTTPAIALSSGRKEEEGDSWLKDKPSGWEGRSWIKTDQKHKGSAQGHDSRLSNDSEGDWHGLK